MDDDVTGGPQLRVVDGGAAAAVDEDALVQAWLAGDQAAFGALVARHQPLVLAIVRRHAASPEDARDLAQRTFLRAFEAARRALRGGGPGGLPLRRWLARVAINLARNHRRDEGRWSLRSDEATLRAVPAAGATPPEALAQAEAAARMRAEVSRLPARQREVVALRIDAELPFAEIAAVLDVTEGAAKVSFHHAMKRLREVLRQAEEERS